MSRDGSGATVHASAVAIDGQAVMIEGPSGSGKSDLCLRLIDRGAILIGDDRLALERQATRIMASPAPNIAGKIEVRGIGIIDMDFTAPMPIALIVELVEETPRYPLDRAACERLGLTLPLLRINAREPSAAIKVELALAKALDDANIAAQRGRTI